MGKTKVKNIDLSQELNKVSDEHLQELQTAVNRINEIQFKIGSIEAQKHAMLHDLAVSQDKISLLQEMLVKTYGTYDVNLQDGSINRPGQDG